MMMPAQPSSSCDCQSTGVRLSACLREPVAAQAGVNGGRTHRGPQRDPPPVLKTGEPTGTQPLPIASKHTLSQGVWQGRNETPLMRGPLLVPLSCA